MAEITTHFQSGFNPRITECVHFAFKGDISTWKPHLVILLQAIHLQRGYHGVSIARWVADPQKLDLIIGEPTHSAFQNQVEELLSSSFPQGWASKEASRAVTQTPIFKSKLADMAPVLTCPPNCYFVEFFPHSPLAGPAPTPIAEVFTRFLPNPVSDDEDQKMRQEVVDLEEAHQGCEKVFHGISSDEEDGQRRFMGIVWWASAQDCDAAALATGGFLAGECEVHRLEFEDLSLYLTI